MLIIDSQFYCMRMYIVIAIYLIVFTSEQICVLHCINLIICIKSATCICLMSTFLMSSVDGTYSIKTDIILKVPFN